MADTETGAMTGGTALVPAPADRYPVWRWLDGADVRPIVDAERPAAPIPVEHASLTSTDRAAQVRERLPRMCAARVSERSALFSDSDTLLAVAALTLHGVSGQGMSSAAAFDDRLLAHERIAAANTSVFPSAHVNQPIAVHRFARESGIALEPVAAHPVRVAFPARSGRRSHDDHLPERFTEPGAHAVIAEPGGALLGGRYAAVLDAVAAMLADLRGQSEAFAD